MAKEEAAPLSVAEAAVLPAGAFACWVVAAPARTATAFSQAASSLAASSSMPWRCSAAPSSPVTVTCALPEPSPDTWASKGASTPPTELFTLMTRSAYESPSVACPMRAPSCAMASLLPTTMRWSTDPSMSAVLIEPRLKTPMAASGWMETTPSEFTPSTLSMRSVPVTMTGDPSGASVMQQGSGFSLLR